jgi:hypothetical protein
MPVPKSSGSVGSLNRVQLIRHSRTHHSRSSRNTHPRGCSGGLATVLPDDRLADIHLAVGDAFPPIIVRFALRLTESVDLRSTDPTYSQGFWKECGWTSCWSRRRNLGQKRWAGSSCASKAAADKRTRQGECLPWLQVDAVWWFVRW